MDVRKTLTHRTKLENRIRELGGKIPAPWSWDDGTLRNLQLLEIVEDLERGGKGLDHVAAHYRTLT
jgi:hypothetical protein